jgi:ribosome-associated heat shock protein Hsp15
MAPRAERGSAEYHRQTAAWEKKFKGRGSLAGPSSVCHPLAARAAAGYAPKDAVESVRIDQWLSATRIFKSRSAAQQACEAGAVMVNDVAVKSSRAVRVGDRVEARAPRGRTVVVVLALEDKRLGAPGARALYEDHSPPPPPRELMVGLRDRGTGRPTKAERRAMERFVARPDEEQD